MANHLRDTCDKCNKQGDFIILDYTKVATETTSIVHHLCRACAIKLLNPNEQVVLLVTGNGLKDIDAASKNIVFPESVSI